jgi:hypothetical protein
MGGLAIGGLGGPSGVPPFGWAGGEVGLPGAIDGECVGFVVFAGVMGCGPLFPPLVGFPRYSL